MFEGLVAHWKTTLDYPLAFHIFPTYLDGILLLDRLSSLKVLLLEVCAEDVAAVVWLRLEASLVDLGRGSLKSGACTGWQYHLHVIELRA